MKTNDKVNGVVCLGRMEQIKAVIIEAMKTNDIQKGVQLLSSWHYCEGSDE